MEDVWLFQALHTYKLVDEVPARMAQGDWWEVTQNWDYMKAGDKAILWQSDPGAGIYALAELEDRPYKHTDGSRRVNIKYSPLLTKPILKKDLEQHPILGQLLIIKVRNSRNPTKVSPEQWEALKALRGHP